MKFIWHLEFNILHSGQIKQSCEEGIQVYIKDSSCIM